jgi:hypothetical protein
LRDDFVRPEPFWEKQWAEIRAWDLAAEQGSS